MLGGLPADGAAAWHHPCCRLRSVVHHVRAGHSGRISIEIGHFQISPSKVFLPTRGGTPELRCGVRRPILSCINKARGKGDRRAWHGGCFAREQCQRAHLLSRSERSATRNPQLGGGRSLGGIRADGRPQEHPPLVDDVNVLVPIWPGGPWRPPSLAIGPGQEIYLGG